MYSTDSGMALDPETLAPAMPESIEETGLDFGFMADLALKTVYGDASATSERVADKLRLPMGITEKLLEHLYREKLIEIRARKGIQSNHYAMVDRGWERAQHLLDVSGYVGPTPVSLDGYTTMVRTLEEMRPVARPESVSEALSGLVLSDSAIETFGLVLDSRRSLFLTGPPGCGKTSSAIALHNALEGDLWIPYAVEVDGHVIRVFDMHVHHPVTPAPNFRHDRRWVKIHRPMVIVGGELTIESMDLIYSPNVRFYEAPFQVKSNGGMLIIDDFGRQRVDPHDLLNRWIIPLESRVDYLTLHTGKKIEVPFLQVLVFATNLNPKDLVDEAFLRRMGYRLLFTTPSVEIYERILRRYVESKGLPYQPEYLDVLVARYKRERREMKSCDPRDLVDRCLDICRYQKVAPWINTELLERAWDNYFGTTSASREAGARSSSLPGGGGAHSGA